LTGAPPFCTVRDRRALAGDEPEVRILRTLLVLLLVVLLLFFLFAVVSLSLLQLLIEELGERLGRRSAGEARVLAAPGLERFAPLGLIHLARADQVVAAVDLVPGHGLPLPTNPAFPLEAERFER